MNRPTLVRRASMAAGALMLCALLVSIPACTTPPPSKQMQRTHTIRPGDTFAAIANEYYGESSNWRIIVDANRHLVEDPRLFTVGMVLIIPPLDESASAMTVAPVAGEVDHE